MTSGPLVVSDVHHEPRGWHLVNGPIRLYRR
jgi:hypothetical protein